MVARAGLEPAQLNRRGILSPLCLPISPSGHSTEVEFYPIFGFFDKSFLRKFLKSVVITGVGESPSFVIIFCC